MRLLLNCIGLGNDGTDDDFQRGACGDEGMMPPVSPNPLIPAGGRARLGGPVYLPERLWGLGLSEP